LGESGATGTRIVVHDLAGRIVRILEGNDLSTDGRIATWPGIDAQGNAARAGVYFFRVEEPGQEERTGRVVLLR
jgi:hypothetical protein